MSHSKQYLGLDIGTTRTGVAVADSAVKIAVAYDTIAMNEATFRADIAKLVTQLNIDTIVVGYPRNQSGEPTQQTEYVITQAEQLQDMDAKIVFQDESLTSVAAKERLGARGGAYNKAAVDAEAATIILQDYLELHS